MKVLRVYPAGIHVDTTFTLEQLKQIKKGLDLANIDYDGKNVEEKEAVFYLTKEFYTVIKGLIEEVEGR